MEYILKSLKIQGIRSVASVIPASEIDKIDRPAVILGVVDHQELWSSVLSSCGIIIPLRLAKAGHARAVASGNFNAETLVLLNASEHVTVLGSDPTFAPKFAVLENAACATLAAIAAEAYKLGSNTGIDLFLLYRALAGGAGASWPFRELVPELLKGSDTVPEGGFTLQDAKSALSTALAVAAQEEFFSTLNALALQVYQGVKNGKAKQSAMAVAGKIPPVPMTKGVQSTNGLMASTSPKKVGFIGLGAMGSRMARVLTAEAIPTCGFDVWEPSRLSHLQAGGLVANSLADCAEESDILLLMVINAAQVESVLMSPGVLQNLAPDAVILVMSTIPPTEAIRIAAKLKVMRSDVHFIDCPVSGGTPRAATGDLMILASGLEDAGPNSQKALRVLQLLSGRQGRPDNLVLVPGGIGKGSAVKLVNQHLAGCHISAVMETLAFATKLGLPSFKTHDLLLNGPAWSWMLGHRGLNMLKGLIQPPTSTVNIFVKDTSIVVDEAAALKVSVPLAALVQQQFIWGKSLGWGLDDDSSLVRLWSAAGIDVAGFAAKQV